MGRAGCFSPPGTPAPAPGAGPRVTSVRPARGPLGPEPGGAPGCGRPPCPGPWTGAEPTPRDDGPARPAPFGSKARDRPRVTSAQLTRRPAPPPPPAPAPALGANPRAAAVRSTRRPRPSPRREPPGYGAVSPVGRLRAGGRGRGLSPGHGKGQGGAGRGGRPPGVPARTAKGRAPGACSWGPALVIAERSALRGPRQLSSSSMRKPRIGLGACCIGCGLCGRTGAIGWVIAGDICCCPP